MPFNLTGITNFFSGVAQKPIKPEEESHITEGKNQLKVILSGIKEGILILDTNGQILLMNETAANLLGCTPQSTVGKKLDQAVRLIQNTTDVTSNLFIGNALENVKIQTPENIAKGKEIYVNISVSKIDEKTGFGWLVTMHDVSYEYGIEQMRVGFVSVAAHELRTPITSIKGYVEAFTDDYGDKLNEDQKTLINHIKDNADRLASLVENLLNVSRVERGTLSLSTEEVNWDEFLKSIVEDLKERATEKSISLMYSSPASQLPGIRIDKVRMSEVVSNLVSNSINYTSPNGKIQVWTELKGSEIITHVADNGIGIPEDAIGHLFTKFFRVTKGLTQQQYSQGNGLGLYISKEIVTMHGGKIWVESQVGKGSIFSFSLSIS